MREGKKNWYCENHEKCGFRLWKEISGKKISADDAEKLLKERKSGLIKGFKSKNKDRSFSAYLVLGADNQLSLNLKNRGEIWEDMNILPERILTRRGICNGRGQKGKSQEPPVNRNL